MNSNKNNTNNMNNNSNKPTNNISNNSNKSNAKAVAILMAQIRTRIQKLTAILINSNN